MGIQINGVTDSISAVDGSLSLTGAELASVGGINVSGVVTATTYIVGSGSTSAPSISPSGDNNTGIFFPSADTIAFGEGGAEVVRIDSNGRVAIGTNTSLSAEFEVFGGTTSTIQIKGGAGGSDTARRATLALLASGNKLYNLRADASDGSFQVLDSSTERVRIDSNGNLGVGVTSISFSQFGSNTGGVAIADIGATNTGLKISDGSYHNYLVQAGNSNFYISHYGASGDMIFSVGSAGEERARIDSSGRLLVGTSTDRFSTKLLVEGTDGTGGATFARSSNDAGPPYSFFIKSRGTNVGSNTVVQSGDTLGFIGFYGTDGTSPISGASIQAQVDATPGTNDMPGRLVFSTTADGASSPTERMRITSDGAALFTKSGTYGNLSSSPSFHSFAVNQTNQWVLGLYQQGSTGGYGVVVSYPNSDPNNATNEPFYFTTSGGVRFNVRSNGGIANYQANNANLCDEREKKNIVNLDSTWDCLKHWELKKFHYNEDADDADLRYGVIAQQVAQHCPEVISDWVKQKAEDAVLDDAGNVITPAKEEITRMAVKEQQMYWMAIKALQEAQVRIEALEAEVAALKAQ